MQVPRAVCNLDEGPPGPGASPANNLYIYILYTTCLLRVRVIIVIYTPTLLVYRVCVCVYVCVLRAHVCGACSASAVQMCHPT